MRHPLVAQLAEAPDCGRKFGMVLVQVQPRGFSNVSKMTQDYEQALREACQQEGAHFLCVLTTDRGQTFRITHNFHDLPQIVDYPDGCRRPRCEDMAQLVSTLTFAQPDE